MRKNITMKLSFAVSLVVGMASAAFAEDPRPVSAPPGAVGADYVYDAAASDAFDGTALDAKKWDDWVASFQGRSRGFLFARDNVAVSNGCLNLTARLMRPEEKTVENLRRGFDTYATAYVRAKEKTFYGYYECRAKSMRACVCNAFWLYDPLSDQPEKKFRPGDFSEEIDIFEVFGKPSPKPPFEDITRKCFTTVHRMVTPYLEGIAYGGAFKLENKAGRTVVPFDFWDGYHTYGLRWTEKDLTWYADGVEIFSRTNDYFHRPMHVTFDCEIMYSWSGEPDKADLPQTFSIDYFRHWRPVARQLPEPGWLSSGNDVSRDKPAPVYEKSFVLAEKPTSASIRLATAGWAEISVNGTRLGDTVLSPVTCQPDVRISELAYDIAPYLCTGTNEVRVLMGNGWWYCATEGAWGFEHAPWHAADPWQRGPMIRGEIVADGRRVAVTDASWTVSESPIVFNQLRNGEYYDARREDAAPRRWKVRVLHNPPFQLTSPEDAAPCRVFDTNAPVREIAQADGSTIYDFGRNLTGWCEIDVVGEAGAKVTIDYDESLTTNNTLKGHITTLNAKNRWPVQHDEYTLAGRANGESWHPRFTYHGFRYAHVKITGKATIKAIRQRFVHSDFASVGSLETSDAAFAKFQSAVRQSYLSNFTGIPTDCPHREKNGWTGDAQLACEAGLWNFDAKKGYEHYLRMMKDAQKPSGIVPCIVPCTPAFGYGWGTGPAWDLVIFEIPRQVYRFYGDDGLARELYGTMKRYLPYAFTKREADGLFHYGLGDWCHPAEAKAVDSRLTDSAIVYHMCRELADWARHFGEPDVAADYEARAKDIKSAFNRKFYRGNGVYGNNGLTANAAAPFYGLCPDGEKNKVVSNLVAVVRQERHRAVFGIFGSKWVPRVLAANGYVEDAWKIFTQQEFPAFQNMLEKEDTLWEAFTPGISHNHIMFGDGSAWAYEYVAGIKPLEPGFKKVSVTPHPIPGVARFVAKHQTPHGEIVAGWETQNGQIRIIREVPPEITLVTAK